MHTYIIYNTKMELASEPRSLPSRPRRFRISRGPRKRRPRSHFQRFILGTSRHAGKTSSASLVRSNAISRVASSQSPTVPMNACSCGGALWAPQARPPRIRSGGLRALRPRCFSRGVLRGALAASSPNSSPTNVWNRSRSRPDLEHSLSRSYARGILRSGSTRWAVLAVPLGVSVRASPKTA